MPIKAIIIDDERLARNELKKLLQQHSDISIIDDLKLTNVSSSCTLALGTPVVACSASTLALDSYTVTIPYTGAGNATYTITTAGTVSGDNPTSVAAGNIIVTFTEGSAYTVNITGGTCNLDVNGNSPECKPENTLPYYDGFIS